jgi:hypothetical protein
MGEAGFVSDTDNDLARSVERGNLDELTRMVDRLCDSGDWDHLQIGRAHV